MLLAQNACILVAVRGMDAPAFPEFSEAKLQKILGKWEHLQITFADALEEIHRDVNFWTGTGRAVSTGPIPAVARPIT